MLLISKTKNTPRPCPRRRHLASVGWLILGPHYGHKGKFQSPTCRHGAPALYLDISIEKNFVPTVLVRDGIVWIQIVLQVLEFLIKLWAQDRATKVPYLSTSHQRRGPWELDRYSPQLDKLLCVLIMGSGSDAHSSNLNDSRLENCNAV